VIVVVLLPLSTWWAVVPELPLKLVSPAYVAVMVFGPAEVDINGQLPVPPLRLIVQLSPVPSETLTEPDGVPTAGDTGATATLTV
jgi:hypothetical protein